MGVLENTRHECFAHEFLIDRNMTQAAIRAGYSERSARSQGNRLMKKADILARVRELQHEQCERLCMNADWVLLNLAKVVDQSMQAEPVMAMDPASRQMVETGEYVFDSKGANRALELIGKHMGMFGDKLKIENAVPVVIVNDLAEDPT